MKKYKLLWRNPDGDTIVREQDVPFTPDQMRAFDRDALDREHRPDGPQLSYEMMRLIGLIGLMP